MVVTSIKPQRLAARDGPNDGEWGTPQIVTPAIVGGVLLLLFAAYVIWQRRPRNRRSYDYQQVRSEWVSRMERIFVTRRKRVQVAHSSAPVTLDDSMRTSRFTFDFSRRSRQFRSDSSDSHAPLTSTSYAFDYPPSNLSDSPPPIADPKRRTVRWWWFFGSRPQQIKSAEPNLRWRVDDPDESNHGHSSHGSRFATALEPLHEDPEDVEDDVIRIGENFASLSSTPMTQHFPEQASVVLGMPAIPEHPLPSVARTPAPALNTVQINPGTPVSSVNRGLPPSYDVSQSHTQYPTSTEDYVLLVPSGPYIMALPPPVRAAGYPSPRAFHGRDLSSDSFLATQPPMVVSSAY